LLERDILARLPISQIREVTAAAIAGSNFERLTVRTKGSRC